MLSDSALLESGKGASTAGLEVMWYGEALLIRDSMQQRTMAGWRTALL
jgi:hypothetical protein